jgi:dTDP-4-dehydrorhamnose 3,5-epimerase
VPFEFVRLEIPELILVRARAYPDERGVFVETYKRSEFEANGIKDAFVQDNSSRSTRGVLRGLHYQMPPKAQGKLISVVRGEVFDVAVDIRRGSPTYGKWLGRRLTEGAHQLLYVPAGFAHGFQVLSNVAYVVYKVTEEYAPDADRGIIWDDPVLAIDWPIHEPLLSSKDAALPTLERAENAFTYEGETVT